MFLLPFSQGGGILLPLHSYILSMLSGPLVLSLMLTQADLGHAQWEHPGEYQPWTTNREENKVNDAKRLNKAPYIPMCLDGSHGSSAWMKECNGKSNQRWRKEPTGDGSFQFRLESNGACLTYQYSTLYIFGCGTYETGYEATKDNQKWDTQGPMGNMRMKNTRRFGPAWLHYYSDHQADKLGRCKLVLGPRSSGQAPHWKPVRKTPENILLGYFGPEGRASTTTSTTTTTTTTSTTTTTTPWGRGVYWYMGEAGQNCLDVCGGKDQCLEDAWPQSEAHFKSIVSKVGGKNCKSIEPGDWQVNPGIYVELESECFWKAARPNDIRCYAKTWQVARYCPCKSKRTRVTTTAAPTSTPQPSKPSRRRSGRRRRRRKSGRRRRRKVESGDIQFSKRRRRRRRRSKVESGDIQSSRRRRRRRRRRKSSPSASA